MSEALFVFYEKELVGKLSKKSDATVAFTYSKSWKESSIGFELSPILNFEREGEFNHRETQSYFENLLPEGRVKDRVEKMVGKSLGSSFQFLQEYGVDCAGAFVVTENDHYQDVKVENDFEKINLDDLANAHKKNQNLMAHVLKEYKGKFSLAGAQDKVAVVVIDDEVYVPTKGAATTHILKPPHYDHDVKDNTYNEYISMKLAAAAGLAVAEVSMIESSMPFYIIKRFDREISNDEIKRLHQIDFCQAQGKLVDEKYEAQQGPSLKSNYELLSSVSFNPIEDIKQYMRWICFNILIGNNDSHSKNISLLWNGSGYKLSPFYDILCTNIYPHYETQFAFKIGGNRNWGLWTAEHFKNEMISWKLDKSKDLLIETMKDVIKTLDQKMDNEINLFNQKFSRIKIANRIKTEIEKRVNSFNKRF